MSLGYQAVGWNRQKKLYDGVLAAGVLVYLGTFVALNLVLFPTATLETVLIRGFGTGALLLLHIILAIGPLCRLDARFLPLLYNRRHLGVTMFFLGLAHAALAVLQFHAFSDVHPLVSIFVSNNDYGVLSEFPFQPLGFFALCILFLMAATSHDFWLANLTAPVWKTLHMLVYVAYGLLIAHVALGVLQAETSPVLTGILGLGLVLIVTLHLIAAFKERGRELEPEVQNGWVEVCAVADIEEDRAKIVTVSGERVAVFRYEGKVSAVSNVCRHQNGPVGEGKIIDGCITCPWHGFQYRPDDGCSPPPFTEKLPTFRVKVEAGRVFVDPRPLDAGTRVAPALIGEEV